MPNAKFFSVHLSSKTQKKKKHENNANLPNFKKKRHTKRQKKQHRWLPASLATREGMGFKHISATTPNTKLCSSLLSIFSTPTITPSQTPKQDIHTEAKETAVAVCLTMPVVHRVDTGLDLLLPHVRVGGLPRPHPVGAAPCVPRNTPHPPRYPTAFPPGSVAAVRKPNSVGEVECEVMPNWVG